MTSPTTLRHPIHLRALTLGMLAVCGLAGVARAEEAGGAPQDGTQPAGAATEAQTAPAAVPPAQEGPGAQAAAEERRLAAGAALYQEGVRARDQGRIDEALRALTAAVERDSANALYRKTLDGVRAMAGADGGARGAAVDRVTDELMVRQQQLLIEATAKLEDAEKLIASGRYGDAERELQMARARLEGLPFADGRREQGLRRADSLLAEAAARRAAQDRSESAARAQAALDQQAALRDMSLKIERDRIEAMISRAQRARDRRDFDEAILLCEQVLKLNRAEDRAASLLAKCRRERHAYLRQITADRWDEEHQLLSEQIRTALLPQLEIIKYSSDWPEIDFRRTAPSRAGAKDASSEAWRKDIDNKLEQEVSLDFQDQDLAEVVGFLQQVTNANIVLDPQVIAASPPPITLRVDKMKLRYVLDFIMKITNLTYALKDEAIFISSAAGVRGDAFMKIYDIRDLTHAPKSFPGPEMDIPQPGGTGATLLPAIEQEQQPEANEFIDIIKKVVAPDTWQPENGTDIGEFNGNMVVTQTADVHRLVEEMLRALRNQKGTQIHVKCKFLNIENAAVEEIGVNWRNFTGPIGGSITGGQQLGPGTGNNGGGVLLPGTVNPVGAYWADPANQIAGAGTLNNPLPAFTTSRGVTAGVNEGLVLNTQMWQVANNLYASAVINAVEKERKGNIILEPDLTMFNGQQAHLVQLNQQSYISDYDVVQSQYQPVIATLAYGTVLDVMAIASADKKYITLTLRPTSARVDNWRRFGPPVGAGSFPGGNVEQAGDGIGSGGAGFGLNPILVPSIRYEAVRTSVTIPDGGSLVIGGMTNGDSERTHAGVPFLSHIPFLGRLFSSNGRKETQLQTMIVVQADVVLFEEIEKNL